MAERGSLANSLSQTIEAQSKHERKALLLDETHLNNLAFTQSIVCDSNLRLCITLKAPS